jgi:hypothetical protein
MAIDARLSGNFSLPPLDGRDTGTPLGVDDGADGQAQAKGLSGDDLMGMNVWGPGAKMLVDDRALSGQPLSAHDIANLVVVRG